MNVSKYVYGEIKKVVNGNEYQIGYINIKVYPIFDGKPDAKIIANNNWCTKYCLYKNNQLTEGVFKDNLAKEELLNKFNELIECYEKRNIIEKE